jgi:hypothetical protein
VPSGAPTGFELAEKLWTDITKGPSQSDDLIETASILERRYGRRAIVDVVVRTLTPLRPTGGLLALPRFGWSKLFSTNFDRLIERSFKASSVPLTTFRSNYDFSSKDAAGTTPLYKIHGCISQDRSLGDKSSMILTADDYDSYKSYKQSLFSNLAASLQTQDALIIGQSLRDKHLADLIKEVLALKAEGLPGQVYALVYDRDDLRAPLLEDKGAYLAFGGIDDFAGEMVSTYSRPSAPAFAIGTALPVELMPVTFDVQVQQVRPSNAKRMFNGGPASYADIAAGITFDRASFSEARDKIESGDRAVVAIVGAAGVGKTTFARQLLSGAVRSGHEAWEHRADFPFQYKYWLEVESALKVVGKRGVLLIDECTHYLRAVNLLLEKLATMVDPALQLVVTANAAQWTPRLKQLSLLMVPFSSFLSYWTQKSTH